MKQMFLRKGERYLPIQKSLNLKNIESKSADSAGWGREDEKS